MRNFLRGLFTTPVLPPDPFGEPPREDGTLTAEQQSSGAFATGIAAASVAGIQRL